jgi:ABC-type proline/glycine betaine transport system ATPase subunit
MSSRKTRVAAVRTGVTLRVHRPEQIVISPCFDVVERFVHRRQREIARRDMAHIDDAGCTSSNN